jgi:predicted CopG family antitoxin
MLRKMKLPQESFGDTIERLCSSYTTNNLKEWIEKTDGWEEMTNEEYMEIMEAVKGFGKTFKPYHED